MTTISLASSTAGRIGHLVRLLGSDKAGEVVAPASAIKRTLYAAGIDLHTLAEVAEKVLTLAPSLPQDHAAEFDVGLVIRFCARRAHKLTERERIFINDLDRLARRFGDRLELSPKQGAWLFSIFEKLQ